MAKVNRGKRLRSMDINKYIDKLRFIIVSHIELDAETGCWLWKGTKLKQGYGSTRLLGVVTPAHRASFFAFNGIIEEGKEVCHVCDVRSCVRPEHLFLATHAENMIDMKEKGRSRNGIQSGAYIPDRDDNGRFLKMRKKNGKRS